MLAIVCPGQGSQVPGFLSPWLELESVRERLLELSEASKTDLILHGTTSDEATIKDTSIAQPLIVAAGIISSQVLDVKPELYAGHSVGEITAAALAGVFSPLDAARLVGERARLMAGASAEEETTMMALLGGVESEVLSAIEAAGASVANVNAPGQIVAAGSRAAINALATQPPARTKAIELKVAGAFHTSYMSSATAPLTQMARELDVQDPNTTILTNEDGRVVESGETFRDLIISQITRPVRWDSCMNTMGALGVTGVLELSPAGTLAGLAKRGLKTAERFTLNSPEDLEAAREFAAAHAGAEKKEATKA